MTTVATSVRSSAVWPVLVGVGVLAGAVAAGLGAMSLADALTATGLPDPGPVTTYGLPFVRAAGEIAAVVAVGSFLLAAFLVPPQANGVLDAGGYRALRLGTVASGVWTVCAVLLVPLTVSDVTGQPVGSRLSPSAIWSVASLVETAGAWRWTAFLAAGVTIASIPVLRWSPTPLLFAGSLATLLPLALTGHSSSGGSHDLATNSLLIHLVAGALWAGGLLALLVHALRGGEHAYLAARRFSAVALWCFVAMALSGIVNALVRVRPADLLNTTYGWLIVGKAAALCVLGTIGWLHRRRGIAALRSDPAARGPPDQAGARRSGGIRTDVRHRRRTGPDTATRAADLQPLDPGDRDRLRLRGAAHCGAGAVRLALRPDLRHRRNRVRGRVCAGRGQAAAPRRRVARRSHRGVAAGMSGPAVRHVIGCGPLHAGDVQHAHGGTHAAVDAHTDPARARRSGHPGAAGITRRGSR